LLLCGSGSGGLKIPIEINLNADWVKYLTTLFGSHFVNKGANIIKLSDLVNINLLKINYISVI